MGDHVAKYNDHLEQVTQGLYGNFGIAGMLNVAK
jgi:hypothetical protein